VLATKWVATATPPYLLLLIGSTRGADLTQIEFGFRLYPDGDPIAKATSPDEVFMWLLARFGLPVAVGDQRGLFLVRAQVKVQGGNFAQLVKVDQPRNERVIVSTLMKSHSTSPPIVDIAWAYAINAEKYAAAVSKHRR
jgi:hypothetical protein